MDWDSIPTQPALTMAEAAWSAKCAPNRAAAPSGTAALDGSLVGSRTPRAHSVPVSAVMRLAVEVVVVVTAAPVPVVAPRRVEPLSGTPVVIGQRGGRLGFGQARRADTGKTQARGDGGSGCDSFHIHGTVVPLRSPAETSLLGVLCWRLAGNQLDIGWCARAAT